MAHTRWHVPSPEKLPATNSASAVHDVQPVAVPSTHVPQVGSHVAHTWSSPGYLPAGHSVRQAPRSEYLVPLDGQLRHALLEALEQESHEG